MEQNVVKTNFSFPKWDAKKVSGSFITLVLLGAIGLLFYFYILPFLLSVVWGTVELIVGLIIGAFLLAIVTNKKFWRGMRYLSEAIAQYTLGFAIELNPFNILYLQVEESEKDLNTLQEQTTRLKGQQAKLNNDLGLRDKEMQLAAQEVDILKSRLQKSPTDEDAQLQLESSSAKFTNAKDFIDSVKPIANDIDKLVLFGEKAYKKASNALKIAKERIKMQKATYEAVTTGASAMKAAMRAFTGNPDLNNDADKALDVLRSDIAQKIGVIKSAIQVTSDVMNKQDLSDAAKTRLAAETAEKFNLDKQLDYSSTVTNTASGLDTVKVSGGNNYFEFLK